MTCQEISLALSVNEPLSKDAAQHIHGCLCCTALAHLSIDLQQVTGAEPKLAPRFPEGQLTPVSRLGSYQRDAIFAACSYLTLLWLGLLFLGLDGWKSSTSWARIVFILALVTALSGSLWILPRLMTPGSRVTIPLPAYGLGAFALATFLYPSLGYLSFGFAACLANGIIAGSAGALMAYLILRRGYIMAPTRAGAMAGFFGGLCGISIQIGSCPGHTAEHYLLAHFASLALLTLAGALALSRHQPS